MKQFKVIMIDENDDVDIMVVKANDIAEAVEKFEEMKNVENWKSDLIDLDKRIYRRYIDIQLSKDEKSRHYQVFFIECKFI